HFRHNLEQLPCPTGSFLPSERSPKVKNRASTPRRDTASPPLLDRATPPGDSAGLATGPAGSGGVSYASPRTASLDLRRAIDHWFADGRAQGWSARTLGNRQHLLAHFIWWLENEERVAATLEALTPARIRAFMAYAREPNREGRYGSSSPSA